MLRPIIENDPTGSIITGPTGNAHLAIVHRVGIAAADGVDGFFIEHRRENGMLLTNPDAGKSVERTHPMTIARMGAPHLTKRVWNRWCSCT